MTQPNLFICSLVAHDAHCFDGEKDSKCLADLVVESSRTDLFDVDAVCALEDFYLLTSNGTQYPDSKTRTREGVPLHERSRYGQQAAKCSHFIYRHGVVEPS
jgi:hypothetical protein